VSEVNLLLCLPHGAITATSLGVEGFVWHRRPGSGKHFRDRSVVFDLSLANGRPDFDFLDEGGWRAAREDTLAALEAVAAQGKRTKTALSNNAFSCTPIGSFRRGYLVKTGGALLELRPGGETAHFVAGDCNEGLAPDEVAAAAGSAPPPTRTPRLYMVLCPLEFLVMSTLAPPEYAWYATHRPGKVFRQILFAELQCEQHHLAARSLYDDARAELEGNPLKKTKTIVLGGVLNHVPFEEWVGYGAPAAGGLYAGDRTRLEMWRFPDRIPLAWERADG